MKVIERIKSDEGNLFAMGIAWTIGLLWFTLLGFYLGTISGSDHRGDLNVALVTGPGLTGMAIGFVVGLTVAICVTLFYPHVTDSEARAEAEAHH